MGQKLEIVWTNVVLFIMYHYFALHGLYHLATASVLPKTLLWFSVILIMSNQGITAGAHRLWSHKAFKVKLPLKVFLVVCQTIAFQNDIYEWARDHRVHHKYTDTKADPHDSTRGFFFCHMGWLLCRKHPEVAIQGKTIDMSDLEADPLVMFQRKYYFILAPVFSFIIPTVVPRFFWGENVYVSLCVAAMLRYMISLHITWLVNSAGHMWGYKPYDRFITPVENTVVAYLTLGEGWHNYHHTFPQDYKGSELGVTLDNVTTAFIHFMNKIGWAYDLKTVSKEEVLKRIMKNGILNGAVEIAST
ncbi:FA desaturase domain containing protein [Asbolus verrucosus]|uniref:FA desaturase domain containing protein n=1 Tax=Asbolus verrucosus TaxID=1661398 RepID=A0A482VCV0_ASBVE|nr:FA desaturase domain containing protein [Asbolus verrucosus]